MRPQLHISGLNMLAQCGERFRRVHMEGERIAPGVAMIVGTATDDSITANLQGKIDTGQLRPLPEVLDVARDALNQHWDEGVRLDDDERGQGEKTVRGAAVDKAIRLAQLHAVGLAPTLAPTRVQRKWVLELPAGYNGYEFAGTLDIQEGIVTVRDTKTAAKSPAADAADTSDQLTSYAMAVSVLDRHIPLVYLDHLIDLKRGPVSKTLWSSRDRDDFVRLLRRVATAIQTIDAGTFMPTSQSIPGNWWCSPKYCGFYETCPYVRNPVMVAI